jgi:hypothetical protein
MTTPRPSVEPGAMRVRLHLSAARGTKRLLARYGDRLVGVRYRYDPAHGKRFNTVELLIAERDWSPPRLAPPVDRLVPVRVAFTELAVRQQVKQAGGTWNQDRKASELRYDRAVALGLEDRIVPDGGSLRATGI